MRAEPDDVTRLYARSAKGEMVPLVDAGDASSRSSGRR